MINLTPQEKINIYKQLFKGREDVFALRWEKADGSASGYTPVCLNEWKQGICLKLKREKCRDCKNQNYAVLNDYYIEQHNGGNHLHRYNAPSTPYIFSCCEHWLQRKCSLLIHLIFH